MYLGTRADDVPRVVDGAGLGGATVGSLADKGGLGAHRSTGGPPHNVPAPVLVERRSCARSVA